MLVVYGTLAVEAALNGSDDFDVGLLDACKQLRQFLGSRFRHLSKRSPAKMPYRSAFPCRVLGRDRSRDAPLHRQRPCLAASRRQHSGNSLCRAGLLRTAVCRILWTESSRRCRRC
jgi:hypothetical protein